MYKPNDTIFVYESWTDNIYKATVNKVDEEKQIVDIFYENLVDRDGNELTFFNGMASYPFDRVYDTVQDAYAYKDNMHTEQVNKYLEEIQTKEDLINFPLTHCLCGNEYTDYDAVEAYKIKVRALLRIDI